MYELPLDAEETMRVHESPSVQWVDGTPVVVRRFELGASYLDLEFTAHMEAGRMTTIGQNSAAMGILREKDVLLVAFRGRPLLGWKPATAPPATRRASCRLASPLASPGPRCSSVAAGFPVSAAGRAYDDAARRLLGEAVAMTIQSDRRSFFNRLFQRKAA